ncbi:hypothetical protein PG993_003753 [Apiospora rasikravindrae]|uniref:Uncharacterized protein n=1 Tax=Apiospora rasikravindrae TaxID=990691 RepID=A0ABR1U339_9PEZI
MGRSRIFAAAFAALASLATAMKSPSSRLSASAQDLFDYSMSVSDSRYDASYNFIWYQDNGPWSTRFTAWYLPGLLYRAEGDDVKNAIASIEGILATQMLADYDSPWYGTYKLSPDAPDPTPDSPLYPPSIYDTYDPNWREFIGSQLIQVVEEFSDKIGPELVGRIENSIEAAAVGGTRRNGTFPEDDNLILAYSNPGLMRALTTGWAGKRKNNQTLLDFAKKQGEDLLSLFQRGGQDVMGEYNAPNYYGVDIWALATNAKYGPKDLPMTNDSRIMLKGLWDDIAHQYNPFLGNMVGPYDRAYSRDATTHSQIISLFWWGVFGREYGPQPPLGESDLLYDVAQGAAFALVMDVVTDCVSDEAAELLTAKGWWDGERFMNKTVYEDLTSDRHRVATSWLSAGLMVGGQTVTGETKNRGDQFVPAIVHWASDPKHTPFPYNGFFSLYPSATTIRAEAGPGYLTVAYPNTTQAGADIFTFALSGIPPSWTLRNAHVINGFDDLPCLDVNVSAPGLTPLPVTYGSQLRNHWFYNISYAVPADFQGAPQVRFDLAYTC